jgi:TldD protein
LTRAAAVPAPQQARAHGEACFLERSSLLYVTVDSTRPGRSAVRTCAFEGGRVVGEDGAAFTFSGPPPRGTDFRLPEPAPPAPPGDAEAAVSRLVRGWAGTASVQYLARSSSRTVVAGPSPAAVTESRVWALLGNAVTPGGRVVPVGQSGRGEGLAELAREAETRELARMLACIDRSRPLPGGTTAAVLAPPAAAVLVHEAAGHFAEAAPEGRVDLSHRLGFRIASEIFELLDDPLAEGGAAHYAVDDDGTPTRGATLVMREGRMVRLLHSAASARAAGAEATGNGRAASVWNAPMPRMSNLVCRPGRASEEELLDHLQEGLYVHSLAYGYGFGMRLEAQVRLAEEVKGGRRTGRYFSGGIVDEQRLVLTRAAELGDTAVFNRNAMCGKEGQLLYDVGTCTPAIRMEALRLGA